MIDTRFAEFLQALPADYHQQAYDFKAFARARKVKSPLQLLQLVLAYCGLDLSLRSCAGEVAQMQGYLSDTAVKKGWKRVSRGSNPCWRVYLGWVKLSTAANCVSSSLTVPPYKSRAQPPRLTACTSRLT